MLEARRRRATKLAARAAALPALCALAFGCGPQPIDIKTSFAFTAAQERDALKQQMPPALLTAVGGAIPDPWPATAPRLLVDLLVVARGRVDLKASGVDPSRWAALRVRAVRARTTGAVGLLLPQPAELLLFAGPLGSASLAATGVRRLARAVFPSVPLLIDCTPVKPCDAGAGALLQALELEPAARTGLQDLVLGAGQLELLLAVRTPIDSAADPRAPRGSAEVEIELDLELAP